MTDAKETTTYDEAVETCKRWEREIGLILAIEERNLHVDRGNEWEELRERLIEEYVGEPLSITWHGTNHHNPLYNEDGWEVDHVDVLYGTGGPATGIEFESYNDARVWFQNWFTTREYVSLDSDCAGWLSNHLGLEW